MDPVTEQVELEAGSLHVVRWGDALRDPIVMLHEGLGSVTQWRDVPEQVHLATQRTVIAYDRAGYGRSRLGETSPRYGIDFMHDEATIVLPALLDALGAQDPVLLGHSDGASIALIAAAGPVAPTAVGVIAPHVFVEEVCLEGIRAIAAQRHDVVERLGRHHDEPDLVFDRWREIWLDPAFAAWSIVDLLPHITAPVIAVQGDADEYATEEMLDAIIEHVPDALARFLPACGHVVHRDRPDAIVQLAAEVVQAATAS